MLNFAEQTGSGAVIVVLSFLTRVIFLGIIFTEERSRGSQTRMQQAILYQSRSCKR